MFGGARGGGKTDGVLGKWAIKAGKYGKHFNAIMFRRTAPSQDDAWERARELFEPLGAKFNETSKNIRFPNGGRVRFRQLERVADAEKYQGQNLTDVWIEECGQYPDPAPIDRLHGAMRSAKGVPTQMILTGNPGGAGQHWIKHRYIDPAPGGLKILTRTLPNDAEHRYVFIPSFIQDNKALLEGDPDYINRLYLVGSKELVRAWLEGDWNAVEGAFFDEFDTAKHVLKPFPIPDHWTRFRSMDWGSARPFSVGWWAVASEDHFIDGRTLPRGALIRYKEWYGCVEDKPNTGLKMTAEEVAKGIVMRDGADNISLGVLDPAAFAQDGGPSIAERMVYEGVVFRRADNKRVSRDGAMGGWDQMRARLRGEDGVPALYIFNTCKDFIRTVPVLQHDLMKPEDLDTESEDHVADEVRYACMSRPYISAPPKEWTDPFAPKPMTFMDAVKANQKRLKAKW